MKKIIYYILGFIAAEAMVVVLAMLILHTWSTQGGI
jgi:hypothetical protein